MGARTLRQVGSCQYFDGCYEILDVVGRGRNSVVYRARALPPSKAALKSPERIVALKVSAGQMREPELALRRIEHEALMMERCRHQHVAGLLGFVGSSESSYLVMEFAERGDLHRLLESSRKLVDHRTALGLASQLLLGLEAVHQKGVVHRDIKPENLLLTSDWTLKITDFGISFAPGEAVKLEEANRGVGTFDYLAPECLEEGENDNSSDLYAAAVTLYEILTKHLPFGGSSLSEQIENKMAGNVLPLTSFIPSVPPLLDAFLAKGLSPNPADRFHSAAEFRREIELFLAGQWEADRIKRTRRRPSDVFPKETIAEIRRSTLELRDYQLPVNEEVSSFCLPRFESGEPDRADGTAALRLVDKALAGTQTAIREENPARLSLRTYAVILLVMSLIIADRLHLTEFIEPVARASHGESAAYSFLKDVRRSGILYDLQPTGDIRFSTRMERGSEEVFIDLDLPDWESVIVKREELKEGRKIYIQGQGLALLLSVESEASNSHEILSGRYLELNSGRRGSWELW